MSSKLPIPGDLIDGRYRVLRAIGSGSMGAVFEVSHHVTGRRFALKWLMPELTKVRGSVSRFIREAQIGAQLEHPNLVNVYDIGQDADSLYIVMELLNGEPLSDRLSRVQRLSPRAACELLCPCMEALAEAHAAGVIHRDLKPANIFVCSATNAVPEHARVLDFGVSKLVSGSQLDRPRWTMTSPGMVLGTPHYMAPEQMRGEDVDARADVYAFGVILYEVLSGEAPFQAESFPDLLAQVLTETPRSLSHLASLPEGLSEVVAKAMAREPAARFDSMASLLAALAPFRAGRYERRSAVVERAEVPRPPRRSDAGSIAAFVAALTFVIAGTLATRGSSAEQALQTAEPALQESALAGQASDEPPLEPDASPATNVREVEAVADASAAIRAAREPARRPITVRRSAGAGPTAQKPSNLPAKASSGTLEERPIKSLRLSNGLIDPFGDR